VALRWQYPLWVPAQDVDPRRLRQPISGRQKQQGAADEEGFTLLTSALRQYGVGTLTGLMRWTGLSRERCQRLLNKLEAGGQLTRADAVVAGNRCAEYRLANPNNGEQSPSNPQQFLDFENTNKAGGER
jgi:hypothetical protein